MAEEGLGVVATVCGRYYAMDRDRRWERLKLAYDALVHGEGLHAAGAHAAITESYARDETDEFILPTIVSQDPASRIRHGDGVVFFNFRPDRAREMCAALTQAEFAGFDRGESIPQLDFVGLTEYDPNLGLAVAFPKEEPRNVLAEVVSDGRAHAAAHRRDREVRACDLLLQRRARGAVPGRDTQAHPVAQGGRDLRPEAGHERLRGGGVLRARPWRESPVDFVVLNFANPDMVGHTGDARRRRSRRWGMSTAVWAGCSRVLEEVGAKVIVTADHGNAEEMLEPDGEAEHGSQHRPGPAGGA